MDAEPLFAWSPSPVPSTPPRARLLRELAFAAALSLGLSILVGELDHALRTSGGDAPSATSSLGD